MLEQENRVNRQKLVDNRVQPVCTSSSRLVNPIGIAKVRRMTRFARVFTYETIYIEFVMVLQRYIALEPTVGESQLDVPGTVGWFQDPRPAGLGSASTNVPSCHSGTPRTVLWCLTIINSALHLYPPT